MRLMMIVDHGLCQAKLWLSLVFFRLSLPSLPRRPPPLPLPRCGCGKGNNRQSKKKVVRRIVLESAGAQKGERECAQAEWRVSLVGWDI